MSGTHAEMVAKNKAFTLTSWITQDSWNLITMDCAEGVYFWDADNKRYKDWASQLINVNIGHSHPHVLKAIQEQAARICYPYPGITTMPRARLGEMLQEITPDGLTKSFFTVGGSCRKA
jgi:taurine--2-oxoglutarate transaminase